MIALALTMTPLPDAIDFDAFVKAIGACDRKAVAGIVDTQQTRHSAFLLSAYAEQREITLSRVDLAERRRALRAKEAKVDTEQALALAGDALDDRSRALADARALDQSEQDMVGYFRERYLRQCSGKGL